MKTYTYKEIFQNDRKARPNTLKNQIEYIRAFYVKSPEISKNLYKIYKNSGGKRNYLSIIKPELKKLYGKGVK